MTLNAQSLKFHQILKESFKKLNSCTYVKDLTHTWQGEGCCSVHHLCMDGGFHRLHQVHSWRTCEHREGGVKHGWMDE